MAPEPLVVDHRDRGHSTLCISVFIKRPCRCVSVPAPGLGIIEPCLPSPAKAPPSGPGWLHEIKHDGFRVLATRWCGRAADYTRRKRLFDDPLAGRVRWHELCVALLLD